MVTCQ